MDGYLSVFADILDTLRSIERKVEENSKAIVSTRETLRAEMSEMKTELKEEIASTAESVKTELRAEMAEMKAELKEEIASTAESVKTELRAEMAEMKAELKEEIASTAESVKTELRAEMAEMKTELKAEIKANKDDMINQASDMATEILELVDKDANQTKKRVEQLELAVFHKTCKVCEDGATYDCK